MYTTQHIVVVLYILYCTQHNIVYTTDYTVQYTLLCTLNIRLYTTRTVHCKLYCTLNIILYTTHYTVHFHIIFYTTHSTIQCTLGTTYITQHIILYCVRNALKQLVYTSNWSKLNGEDNPLFYFTINP